MATPEHLVQNLPKTKKIKKKVVDSNDKIEYESYYADTTSQLVAKKSYRKLAEASDKLRELSVSFR